MEDMKYDVRRIDLRNPPEWYKEYLDSLPCCLCGSVGKCTCTGFENRKLGKVIRLKSQKMKPKMKPKMKQEINSVCTPYKDWIEVRIGILSIKDIHRGLQQKFQFESSYTSVKNFVRKVKNLKSIKK